jgi:hypothetical protein
MAAQLKASLDASLASGRGQGPEGEAAAGTILAYVFLGLAYAAMQLCGLFYAVGAVLTGASLALSIVYLVGKKIKPVSLDEEGCAEPEKPGSCTQESASQ